MPWTLVIFFQKGITSSLNLKHVPDYSDRNVKVIANRRHSIDNRFKIKLLSSRENTHHAPKKQTASVWSSLKHGIQLLLITRVKQDQTQDDSQTEEMKPSLSSLSSSSEIYTQSLYNKQIRPTAKDNVES